MARAAGAGGGLEIRNGAANSAVVQAASIVRRAAAARAANPGTPLLSASVQGALYKHSYTRSVHLHR